MINKNERMEKLQNAGINTDKYFTVDLENGAKLHIIVDENGQAKVVDKKTDHIATQIITDGYVKNTKLHRRFVMAQMFHMLNYQSYDGKYEGYTDYLHRMYGYQYTFDMMLEEVRVLSKLETKDKESFDERSHFFTKGIVIEIIEDYIEKLKAYVDKLPTKNCKGVPYKRVKGTNIFVEDLNKKLYGPLLCKLGYIRRALNYPALYVYLNDFMKNMIKLPYDTPKSRAWIDAFKGEGAYYTLKNLLMFHDCYVETKNGIKLYGVKAVGFIDSKLDEYKGEGWRMFALMKKVIEDNEICTKTYIAEICSNK